MPNWHAAYAVCQQAYHVGRLLWNVSWVIWKIWEWLYGLGPIAGLMVSAATTAGALATPRPCPPAAARQSNELRQQQRDLQHLQQQRDALRQQQDALQQRQAQQQAAIQQQQSDLQQRQAQIAAYQAQIRQLQSYAQRVYNLNNSVWSALASGIETENKVRAFFTRRQQDASAGQQLRIQSVVKVENARTLGRFQSAGSFDNNPRTAHQQSGEASPGDAATASGTASPANAPLSQDRPHNHRATTNSAKARQPARSLAPKPMRSCQTGELIGSKSTCYTHPAPR